MDPREQKKHSLRHLCNVVSLLDGFSQGADSCHQLETLRIESRLQRTQHQGKIFLKAPGARVCLRGKTNKALANLLIGGDGVEIVDLQPSEPVLFQVGNRVCGQISPPRCIGCNLVGEKKFHPQNGR